MNSKLIQITAAIAALQSQVIDLANSLQTDIETLEKNFVMPQDDKPLVTTSDNAIVETPKIPVTFMGEIIEKIKQIPFGSSFV
jgi:hypothetical protein